MSPAEYRAALDRIGITAVEFARITGVNERLCRQMCRDDDRGPTEAIQFALKSLEAFKRIATVEDDPANQIDGGYETLSASLSAAVSIAEDALRGDFDGVGES